MTSWCACIYKLLTWSNKNSIYLFPTEKNLFTNNLTIKIESKTHRTQLISYKIGIFFLKKKSGDFILREILQIFKKKKEDGEILSSVRYIASSYS